MRLRAYAACVSLVGLLVGCSGEAPSAARRAYVDAGTGDNGDTLADAHAETAPLGWDWPLGYQCSNDMGQVVDDSGVPVPGVFFADLCGGLHERALSEALYLIFEDNENSAPMCMTIGGHAPGVCSMGCDYWAPHQANAAEMGAELERICALLGGSCIPDERTDCRTDAGASVPCRYCLPP